MAHLAAGPVLVALLLGVGCLALASRVNSVIVDLVSQFVQIAAAVGRMLIMMLVAVVIASILLLHV